MVRSTATTVDQYLAELSDERRDAIEEVRETILEHLPEGFVESMNWGMIAYEVPLETFPDTYNGQPLMYAALASQKNHMAVYLTTVYVDGEIDDWFRDRYEATGKKLDMGKSCVRFKKLEQLPVELIGEVIGRTTLDEFLARYGESMKKRR
jgi:uncharacterized protein YdhG (YjbR/CyaY superfamily)